MEAAGDAEEKASELAALSETISASDDAENELSCELASLVAEGESPAVPAQAENVKSTAAKTATAKVLHFKSISYSKTTGKNEPFPATRIPRKALL